MSESYQWLIICLNHINDWYYVWIIPMIQTYHQSLVWFRHIISQWYDSGILSVIGMIQVYHQLLVWFRHNISHWYDSDIMSESYQWLILCLNHINDWWYAWILPMIISMSESYQLLIICLNHNNEWWYAVYYQSLVWFRYIFNHWYDLDMLSLIGMIQTYYQSLVWFRHTISHW
jgi:hypothetical protein